MASPHLVAIVAGKPDTIDLTGDSDSDYEPHSLVPLNRNNTTTARFTPNFSISSERPSSTNAPVSPPKLNRSTSSIAASQDKQPSASAEPPRPASSVLKLSQKVTTITANSDDAQSMAKLSSVTASNLASRQVTPTPEKDASKSTQQTKPLTQFRQDIKDGHSRMTSYIIESTKPNERRVLTGKNLFAGLTNKPVPSKKGETMRIKSKEHTKLKNNKREDHYSIVRIQTDEERVPRYRFHHVEIKKNILTPNTMLTFVPHLRDLETSEEYKYNVWLQELEDIDRKSGFKPMSREEKVRIAVRSEFASTVLLYLGTWLDKLSLPGCNRSALIRYMASREPDDAITPRQKSDILNSHRPAESTTPPEANKAANMFTEAFRRVFHQGQPPTKQIELRDVLLLDESVDSIMETKPTAKDGSSTQHENEHDAVEYWLGTYSILGCLICFSHSCEHGEYDAQNCKRTLSILPRLSDTLKRRRRLPYSAADTVNGNGPLSPLCKRNCYRSSPRPVAASIQRPWDEEDHFILRSTVQNLPNRECDPDVCGRCGVVERADPENADNEVLHTTGCQNCSLQRGQAKSLALGESQLEGVGYGLFTIEDIAQDDFIIEYVGELITHDEGVRREARRGDVFDEESNISYVFTLLDNEGIWVDAATYGNLSRYINHASESDKRGCNITPRILYVNGEYRIKFTAMRDIKAGEELFFNYGENFPNLTKKLLDHKVGGKSDQGKKRSRRPNGEGVARKNPKTDKKKPGKGKKRAQAVLDEDDMLADTLGFAPKPLRKRKKGPFEEDSEEEEYHPTGTDASIMETPSDGDSDFGNSAARLRKRARQDGKGAASSHNGKPRGDLKTRGKRGGARPGSGRPRKYPRKLTSAPMLEHPSASESQDREDPEERQIVAADTIVPAALQRPQPVEINDSMEYITFSEERTEESRLLQSQLEEDNDEDDDDDDQDVVVRSRVDRGVRNRRPTAKLRDDGDWISGSQ
ncbi:Histone-lysine N-methyltransferase EZH2 [Fusarium oxysporum f. sp. cubense race 1]|uniref:Histone-lysine N-methyltransferase EZH2 n=1 Tax=Fusarium oxysporum f. sp. cubense (strain race 1) TaxID=1229664 RepID=N4TUQ6_FUSC1|nr:Histone-lysine N-methyltransferase EZH2 [Fusarium oxysporum f. sp. cubense race 1]